MYLDLKILAPRQEIQISFVPPLMLLLFMRCAGVGARKRKLKDILSVPGRPFGSRQRKLLSNDVKIFSFSFIPVVQS